MSKIRQKIQAACRWPKDRERAEEILFRCISTLQAQVVHLRMIVDQLEADLYDGKEEEQ